MKAVFASQLDCESDFQKNKKAMLEGASYSRTAFHRFFATAGEMGRSVHEVNDWFGTVGALHCTSQSAA
jgi:hypothetical protein